VMKLRARDRRGSALHWKPRTYLGVCIVAVTGGAIYFAGQAVDSVWSLWTRLGLALGLVALGVVTGSMKLRSWRQGQQWSSTHPVDLTHRAEGSPPSGGRRR
jgi:hypothetical protein